MLDFLCRFAVDVPVRLLIARATVFLLNGGFDGNGKTKPSNNNGGGKGVVPNHPLVADPTGKDTG